MNTTGGQEEFLPACIFNKKGKMGSKDSRDFCMMQKVIFWIL
jgi:hypothetical protein